MVVARTSNRWRHPCLGTTVALYPWLGPFFPVPWLLLVRGKYNIHTLGSTCARWSYKKISFVPQHPIWQKKWPITTYEIVGEAMLNMYLVWNCWSLVISLAIQVPFINHIYIGYIEQKNILNFCTFFSLWALSLWGLYLCSSSSCIQNKKRRWRRAWPIIELSVWLLASGEARVN